MATQSMGWWLVETQNGVRSLCTTSSLPMSVVIPVMCVVRTTLPEYLEKHVRHVNPVQAKSSHT